MTRLRTCTEETPAVKGTDTVWYHPSARIVKTEEMGLGDVRVTQYCPVCDREIINEPDTED